MHHRLFFILLLAAACQSPTTPAAITQNGASDAHFEFSAAAPQSGLQDPANWCIHNFHEAVRLDPVSADANRRVFALGSGVHRVVVDAGGQTASFMLKKTAGKTVEVFTSANFPICLSDRQHFSLQVEDGSLQYNNGKHIQFTAIVAEQPNGTTVELGMAPGASYGFLVHRCEDCE